METLCGGAFRDLAGCLAGAKGEPGKCAAPLTAFDECTEQF